MKYKNCEVIATKAIFFSKMTFLIIIEMTSILQRKALKELLCYCPVTNIQKNV